VLVGRRDALLVTMRQHDRGIDIEHDDPVVDVPASGPRRRQLPEQRPYVGADLRSCLGDPPQLALADLVQGTPARRRRGDRTEQLALVTQYVDVADRLTTVGDHHRQVDPQILRPRSKLHLGSAFLVEDL
jgi:hypothetical protein